MRRWGSRRFPIRRRKEGQGRTLEQWLDVERRGSLQTRTQSAKGRERRRHRRLLGLFLAIDGLCLLRRRILSGCSGSRWPWLDGPDLLSLPQSCLPLRPRTTQAMAQSRRPEDPPRCAALHKTTRSVKLAPLRFPTAQAPFIAGCHLARYR